MTKKKSKSKKRIKQTKASLLLDELADTLASKRKKVKPKRTK